VDRLRTSTDEWLQSGRRAVMMVWWAAVGCGCSALILVPHGWAIGLLATEGDPPPDYSGQGEGQSFLASSWASRAVAAVPSFQTCLHACICTCCTCVCIYVYVCMCTDMCICTYMHVYMYMYTYACIYMCIFMCMHICAQIVSLNSRSSVCLDGVIDAHVYSCGYVCVYTCVNIHMWFFLHWVLRAL